MQALEKVSRNMAGTVVSSPSVSWPWKLTNTTSACFLASAISSVIRFMSSWLGMLSIQFFSSRMNIPAFPKGRTPGSSGLKYPLRISNSISALTFVTFTSSWAIS